MILGIIPVSGVEPLTQSVLLDAILKLVAPLAASVGVINIGFSQANPPLSTSEYDTSTGFIQSTDTKVDVPSITASVRFFDVYHSWILFVYADRRFWNCVLTAVPFVYSIVPPVFNALRFPSHNHPEPSESI